VSVPVLSKNTTGPVDPVSGPPRADYAPAHEHTQFRRHAPGAANQRAGRALPPPFGQKPEARPTEAMMGHRASGRSFTAPWNPGCGAEPAARPRPRRVAIARSPDKYGTHGNTAAMRSGERAAIPRLARDWGRGLGTSRTICMRFDAHRTALPRAHAGRRRAG